MYFLYTHTHTNIYIAVIFCYKTICCMNGFKYFFSVFCVFASDKANINILFFRT